MGESYKKRVHLIDEIRGILIIYVVLYHLLYDISQIFWVGSIDWMYSPWMNILRNTMTGSLIVIAGISCVYSRSNLKRGFKLLGIAMLLTLITAIFLPEELIVFGILHFFGTSILIYVVFEKLLAKIPILIGILGSIYLYFATFHLYEGYIGIFAKIPIALPKQLMNLKIFYPIGFFVEGVYSADYYPLIPWTFLLLAGTFLGRYIKNGNSPNLVYMEHSKKLSMIGRKTLFIYLIHQPIIYGILYLLSR